MSNLLERAIIDAKALKEAAMKNAEQLVIEKYSQEVKDAVNKLLEQDESDAMSDLFGSSEEDEVPVDPEPESSESESLEPMARDDFKTSIPDSFLTDDDKIIKIRLDSLEADIEDEMSGIFGGDDAVDDDEVAIDIEDESDISPDTDFATPDVGSPDMDIDVGGDISPAALEEMIASALQGVLSEEDIEVPLEEDLEEEQEDDLEEEIDLEELMEKMRVDMDPQKSGWAGTPEPIMKEYEAMLLAREQDSEVKEENEELRKNVAALQKENKTLSSAAMKLQNRNKEYNATFKTLQEKLETMNVSNAKLLYINRALENASLNERQKRKIVEAISKADTVQEAKIIFETMNDTVVTTSDVKRNTTLSEMISRKSSLLVATRKEQPKNEANPFFSRMQALAGIKTD
jgi:hypothetical protein